MNIQLCQWLSEAYWSTRERIVNIWKTVAWAVKNSYEAVRDWVYQKTNDAKAAIQATKEYIGNAIEDICQWMLKKWIEAKDICITLYQEFKSEWKKMGGIVRQCLKDMWWNERLEWLKV